MDCREIKGLSTNLPLNPQSQSELSASSSTDTESGLGGSDSDPVSIADSDISCCLSRRIRDVVVVRLFRVRNA